MNADNLVKRGCKPWLPSAEATDLDVWHMYEIPTVGTFRTRGGDLVLFAVVGDLDPEREVTVWAYTKIDEAMVDGLEFDTTAELHEWARQRFAGVHVVYALALDLAVERWSPVENPGDLHSGAVEFMDQVRRSIEPATHDPAVDFEVKQAEVTALVDLVPMSS
ncbi:hypothetical protein [Kribbella kalugense]|uniref:Uncharacterized protein n=1 Tax=Kribbella kalugense TaxID=2512221 RepID=A0A4R7ZPD1_9ACTN|nr:hypothetical protein [Kribbella kalugense]TDW18581.1 hypothetical protein EV650_5170 [Kribbella kalugense]